jgi:hypothetical protein
MPRNPAPARWQEFPPRDSIVAVHTRLGQFASKESIAKSLAAECAHAEELYDQELKEVIEDLIARQNEPAPSLKLMQITLDKHCAILEGMLVLAGMKSDVASLHAQYTGSLQIAEGLIGLARHNGGKSLLAVAEDVSKSARDYAAAQKRVADGGHPVFEEKVAQAATKIWIVTDNAYDALGMCMRKHHISYDPVYAARPTVKTRLRPQLSLTPPGAAKTKPAKAKKAKPAPAATPAKTPTANQPTSQTPVASVPAATQGSNGAGN